jgi:hypothetical protein
VAEDLQAAADQAGVAEEHHLAAADQLADVAERQAAVDQAGVVDRPTGWC